MGIVIHNETTGNNRVFGLNFRQAIGALVLSALAFAFAGETRALTCTPGVNVTSSGFTLGCATPALWAVLAINQPESGKTLDFKAGSGTTGSTQGMQVGIYGGTLKTSSTSTFSGNLVDTSGVYPSGMATNASGVQSGTVVQDDALVTQARADALNAVSKIATYVSTTTSDRHFSSSIGNAQTPMTINALHSGLNLVTIAGNIDISGASEILNFSNSGFSNVQFLVNITGNFKVDNGAQVTLSGLAASDILFNLAGSSSTFTLDHGSRVSGIILDGGGGGDDKIQGGSTLFGAMIGGGNITLDNASFVKNQMTPFGCNVDQQGALTCVIYRAVEPGTVALLLFGLFGVVRTRRTRALASHQAVPSAA